MSDPIGFGICRLALVSIRLEPSTTAPQTTQLLFGDHYEVLEKSGDKQWLFVRVFLDHTEGWIESLQHHEITAEYFHQINNVNYKIVTDVVSTILYKKSPLSILLGSVVPISNSELFKMEEQFAFNGEAKSLGQRRDLEFLRTIAFKYVNAPYMKGGKSPFGIDEAALVQMVFRIAGFGVPRQLAQQWQRLEPYIESEPPESGCIAFFEDRIHRTHHVGIVLDGDRVVHAFGKVRVDHLMEEGIVNLDTKVITHTWKGYWRVIP